jgi:hypothetical protein
MRMFRVCMLVGMLFVAAIAHAQIPLYPYLYSQPYVYTAPDPFAQPFSGPAYFLPPSSAAVQFAVQNSNSNLLNLANCPACPAEELRSQVDQLRKELVTVQAQSQPLPPPPIAAAEPPAMPVVLVFNNGMRIEVRGYALQGNNLWYFSSSGREKVDISTLNVNETQNENRRRGIDFPTPRRR